LAGGVVEVVVVSGIGNGAALAAGLSVGRP
jgi:hypothetical protein